MRDFVEEHADLVIPRAAAIALDPAIVVTRTVSADGTVRALLIIPTTRILAIESLGAFPLARRSGSMVAAGTRRGVEGSGGRVVVAYNGPRYVVGHLVQHVAIQVDSSHCGRAATDSHCDRGGCAAVDSRHTHLALGGVVQAHLDVELVHEILDAGAESCDIMRLVEGADVRKQFEVARGGERIHQLAHDEAHVGVVALRLGG